MYAEIRTTGGEVLESDTFTDEEIMDNYGEPSAIRAFCILYNRIYPRKGGWKVGLRTAFPGGGTSHIQFTKAFPNKTGAISLEPTVVCWHD